jgi:hypothetical protein
VSFFACVNAIELAYVNLDRIKTADQITGKVKVPVAPLEGAQARVPIAAETAEQLATLATLSDAEKIQYKNATGITNLTPVLSSAVAPAVQTIAGVSGIKITASTVQTGDSGSAAPALPTSTPASARFLPKAAPALPVAVSGTIEDELKSLRDNLDVLGEDVTFLTREARRQFNLGTANDVGSNTEFPRLFRRYTDIAGDPRLTLDIRAEDQPNSFTDKQKIGEAFDLLSELKGIVLQIVRSLSKYGTIATSRVNKDWAKFETRALTVLRKVGEKRFTEDVDERRILTVLADLTAKNLETVIDPYFALARNGGELLRLAFETYQRSQNELDNFERERLVNLFQAQGDKAQFLTTRMRNEALVLKRYPLANWG